MASKTSVFERGAERHPKTWLGANMRAADAARGAGLDISRNREAIGAIVLSVLDYMTPIAPATPDTERETPE